jgi:hypothetical protein
MKMNRTYVIIEMANISQVDFDKVIETSQDTLRLSVDSTLAVLKFQGTTPSFLVGLQQYNHSQILDVMATSEWSNR